jgi:phosphoglucomutase
LLSIPESAEGAFLVIGEDEHYYNPEVVQLIAQINTAYNVKKIVVDQNDILSTPAANHVIQKMKVTNDILLIVSHNPEGTVSDVLKVNSS